MLQINDIISVLIGSLSASLTMTLRLNGLFYVMFLNAPSDASRQQEAFNATRICLNTSNVL